MRYTLFTLKFGFRLFKETLRKDSKGGTDNEAKGKGKIDTWLLGVESGYTWWVVKEDVGKGLKIEPHVGATLISTNKDSYEEEGGKNALKVKETKMDRVIGDIGLGVEGKVNRNFNWKAGVEADIVIGGDKAEVLGRGDSGTGYYGKTDERGTDYYDTYGAPVESKSIKEGSVRVGGNVGADYRITKNTKVGANLSVEKGIDGNYREVRGNVGLGVKIGTGRGAKAEGRELRSVVKRLTLRAAEEVEDKKDETRSMLKKKNKEMENKKKELIKKLNEEREKSM